MQSQTEAATEKFLSGYNCAQAVLHSCCDKLNFDKNTALKLACGFGAGMARRQEVCGAVTGGILAIGLRHGRGEGEGQTAKEETYLRVCELMSRFEARHGSCICRKLLKDCDMTTPAGQQYMKEHDLLHKTCVGCVRTVVETLEELL
jgi:C_GCAxxG_C_C family probable redox protein